MNSLGDPSTERLPIESEVLSRFWKETIFTMLFMGICFTCTTWQIIVSGMMVYRTRKIMHWAVFSAVLFSYSSIIATLISPLLSIGCGVRFWVAIIAIDLSGCCVHTILLYKAYICYNKALWVIVIGLFINMGYIALICIYSTVGKTVSIMDIAGNCSIEGLHWQAYAKLGLDLVSNSFLSLAFLLTIYRHYRLFGSFSLKILLSNGIIFFIGVFASNIITTLLISLDVLHGLTSNMYAIDWTITGFLLIKQFKIEKKKDEVEEQDPGTMEAGVGVCTDSIPMESCFNTHSQTYKPLVVPSRTHPLEVVNDTYCQKCYLLLNHDNQVELSMKV